MSNQDDFDTELDVEQNSVSAPRRDEPVADDELTEETTDAEAIDTGEAPPKKPGSGLMFKAVVGVIAAGAIGFFVLRPHPGNQQPAPQPQQQQQAAQTPAPMPADTAQPLAKPADTTAAEPEAPKATTDMDMLPAPVAAKAPAAAASSDDVLDFDAPATKGQKAAQTAAADAQQPAAAAPAQAEIVPDSAAPAPPATMDMPAPAAETKDAAALPAPAKTEAPAAALSPDDKDKIDGIDKRLGNLEETLNALQAKLATKDDIGALQNRIDALEQSKAKPVAAAPVKEKAPAKKKTAAKKPQHHAAATAAHAAAAPAWVLRSAKPGMAWVSAPNSNELKTVAVGDMLSGIGKVTVIDKDSLGRWVVVGTASRLSQ